ncbi:hypothetical protein F5J12DRAFT_719125 [Pisolithus orientalis]|uniref:uncharacterized protein n=1 Tax=Pisolithus orientalis TaxID=936130 RepID=UPI002224357B|nr:uncharacterized protein F5J12DRAFT_719125 [Pisolithus orientalis]KAI6009495.1 hypothetical protein F5J12DRAFT_719125 [Pisolithus orientalis]
MNIIKHVWRYVECHVHTRTTLPSNVTDLWNANVEEWESIEESYLTALYDSMLECVQALLTAKGSHTRY